MTHGGSLINQLHELEYRFQAVERETQVGRVDQSLEMIHTGTDTFGQETLLSAKSKG